jgi:hypothetical protein
MKEGVLVLTLLPRRLLLSAGLWWWGVNRRAHRWRPFLTKTKSNTKRRGQTVASKQGKSLAPRSRRRVATTQPAQTSKNRPIAVTSVRADSKQAKLVQHHGGEHRRAVVRRVKQARRAPGTAGGSVPGVRSSRMRGNAGGNAPYPVRREERSEWRRTSSPRPTSTASAPRACHSFGHP